MIYCVAAKEMYCCDVSPRIPHVFVNEGFSEVDETVADREGRGKIEANIFDGSAMKSGNVKDRII